MTSIDTGRLKMQVDNLIEQSRKIIQLRNSLEKILIWMKCQESEEVDQLIRNVEIQYKELEDEHTKMFLLAAGLQKICDKYDVVEEKLADMSVVASRNAGFVAGVDVDYINKHVLYGGLNFIE